MATCPKVKGLSFIPVSGLGHLKDPKFCRDSWFSPSKAGERQFRSWSECGPRNPKDQGAGRKSRQHQRIGRQNKFKLPPSQFLPKLQIQDILMLPSCVFHGMHPRLPLTFILRCNGGPFLTNLPIGFLPRGTSPDSPQKWALAQASLYPSFDDPASP